MEHAPGGASEEVKLSWARSRYSVETTHNFTEFPGRLRDIPRLDGGVVVRLTAECDADRSSGRQLCADSILVGAVRASRGSMTVAGADRRAARSLNAERSVAMFAAGTLAFGGEYRRKPDILAALSEHGYWDVLAAFFPNKHFCVTAACTRLGQIAMIESQRGWYLSPQGSF